MRTSGLLKRVAADANVILSAAVGKAALRVFLEGNLEVVTTDFNLGEVRTYLPQIAARYGIAPEIAESQLNLLAITSYPRPFYARRLKEARSRIGKRDVDDTDLLALALKLGVPIWSNDRDYQGLGIAVYATRDLLRFLNRA